MLGGVWDFFMWQQGKGKLYSMINRSGQCNMLHSAHSFKKMYPRWLFFLKEQTEKERGKGKGMSNTETTAGTQHKGSDEWKVGK